MGIHPRSQSNATTPPPTDSPVLFVRCVRAIVDAATSRSFGTARRTKAENEAPPFMCRAKIFLFQIVVQCMLYIYTVHDSDAAAAAPLHSRTPGPLVVRAGCARSTDTQRANSSTSKSPQIPGGHRDRRQHQQFLSDVVGRRTSLLGVVVVVAGSRRGGKRCRPRVTNEIVERSSCTQRSSSPPGIVVTSPRTEEGWAPCA